MDSGCQHAWRTVKWSRELWIWRGLWGAWWLKNKSSRGWDSMEALVCPVSKEDSKGRAT